MATPQLQQFNLSAVILSDSPLSIDFPIRDRFGVNIDATTGWTVAAFGALLAANQNKTQLQTDLKTTGTFVFSNGKVTWNLSYDDAQTLASTFPSSRMMAKLTLSNDAGVTEARAGKIALSLDYGLSNGG